jgi:hypothetical protein
LHTLQIWQRHLNNYFYGDAFSLLPLDWVLLAAGHGYLSYYARLLRLLRPVVYRRYNRRAITRIYHSFGWSMKAGWNRLLRVFLFAVALVHFLACFWFAITNHFHADVLDFQVGSEYSYDVVLLCCSLEYSLTLCCCVAP